MCGICGAINLRGQPIPDLATRLEVMSDLIAHRGPDDDGVWTHDRGHVGFGHRRLSVIDPSPGGHQPMRDDAGRWLTYNGEVYNYPELRTELGGRAFRTGCDTEVVLRAYRPVGGGLASTAFAACLPTRCGTRSAEELILCPRPLRHQAILLRPGGRRPLLRLRGKALLPFLPSIETDLEGCSDYLAFQFCLAGKTLFKGVHELLPGHTLTVAKRQDAGGSLLAGLLRPGLGTIRPSISRSGSRRCSRVGAAAPAQRRACGGLLSAAASTPAPWHRWPADHGDGRMKAFTGIFPEDPRYDESQYARERGRVGRTLELREVEIAVEDFLAIDRAGDLSPRLSRRRDPGRSRSTWSPAAAAQERKVVLGGQGGDEIFGGYTRYLIAYFEQCIRAAIDGTMHNGNFVVTYESIIPNWPRCGSTSRCCSSSGAGAVRGHRRRYFRLDRPRARTWPARSLGSAGRLLAVRHLPRDLQRRQRRQGVVLRHDDPFRFQDAAAGAAARRGPGEHGAWRRDARAAA